ncbi:M50 family metallopeptidase [Streptomyces sp. LaPpAH-108]|uniref:M50 family metallopeptidase n=1 Tax=Streptomyces sp. LaPpAH-108 TaxID=1155714 RepID=UPI000376F410|nr:M50 family metallopeptidase [Streptomyces sp. LaPpAH-108]
MTVSGNGTSTLYDTGPLPGPGGWPVTYEQVAAGSLPDAEVPSRPVPRISAGLQLHGEYQGSGFTEPKYIARRGDGQVVQLSRLLYLVASSVDGVRDIDTIAHRVSARFGREVSGENIRYLVENKLEPLGVTVPEGQESDEVDAPRSDLLLALKGHRVIFNERRTAKIARSLQWLHRPPVVAAVLLAAVAMDVWLFGFFGAIEPVLEVLDQPLLILIVFLLTVASLVFHEFGHASACRYGGARPGCIGCGLFLIWPSMYTDVTDVYRINRGGRIRTDFGGVYFNVVFMLAMAGAYFATGEPFFLAAVYLGHFEILEQLMPAVRLDGYYILGDLAGVPDLYGKIKPILLSLLPTAKGRAARVEVAGLKKSARVIVATWVLTMIPLIIAELGYGLWNLPRIISTMVRSLTEQLVGTGSAFADGKIVEGLVGVLGSFMLLCPMAGVIYLTIKIGGRLFRAAKRSTAGRPALRVTLCAALLVGLGGLSYAWMSGATPKPLPKKPPIAPILQPGVPTTAPPPMDASTPDSGTGGPSASPGTASVSPSAVPGAAPSGASGSPSAPASGSASASAPEPSGSPSAKPGKKPTKGTTQPGDSGSNGGTGGDPTQEPTDSATDSPSPTPTESVPASEPPGSTPPPTSPPAQGASS